MPYSSCTRFTGSRSSSSSDVHCDSCGVLLVVHMSFSIQPLDVSLDMGFHIRDLEPTHNCVPIREKVSDCVTVTDRA